MPMFGVTPCPVTIFTFGLLLLTVCPVPRWLFVIPFGSMAKAGAGQARQRETAGLAGQRRLRPAKPDGVLPRLPAPYAATFGDRRAEHHPQRRVRLFTLPRPPRNPPPP